MEKATSAYRSLHFSAGPFQGSVALPSSKSESNRALIMRALSRGGIQLKNLSEARDTQVLTALLASEAETLDVGHAGTAMRFLTAYFSFLPQDKILTGSPRMCQRPIGLLVDALREMGADIQYMGQEGYPPLYVFGRNAHFGASKVAISGQVSSQFISALLMIAPLQPEGLEIELVGKVNSRPYIEMTLALMARFGISYSWKANRIKVPPQGYGWGEYRIESDWSAASYWYCLAALRPGSELMLEGLRKDSLQGDAQIAKLMEPFGISTEFLENGARIRSRKVDLPSEMRLDFSACPDLAQGVVVCMAALGIKGEFTGLESLRIKETDRIAALQAELGKFGIHLTESESEWSLGGNFLASARDIATYEDHRMAMAFAQLAGVCSGIRIQDPGVVAKSYPGFWGDLEAVVG